jgi:Domain of unknown function (DUF4389)
VPDGRVLVEAEEPLRRRRLAVFFRVLLVVPHAIVLNIWNTLVSIVLPISWVLAVLLGRVPAEFHRFMAAYLRYQAQVTAWFVLLSGTYPRFRRMREHPFKVDVPEVQRQRRLITLGRLVLALPALVLASVFGVVLGIVAFCAWFVALALGRTTAGLQELGAFCLRYQLETQAYLMLLTETYPQVAPPQVPKQLSLLEPEELPA